MNRTITILSLSVTIILTGNTTAQTHDSLDINNVNARINSGGDLFWDQDNGVPHFKVPKNDGTQTIFAGNLWIGGYDINSQYHLAAEQFSQNGNDFFPGPIMDSVHYASEAPKWNRVWKVNKTDVDSHITHFNNTGYVIPQVFLDWPAHGDTTLGQSFYLAPYYDHNSDGEYDPADGDAPLIRGDQAVLFIFNDDAQAHTETGGQKLGIQVIAMAYAFDCPQDEALDHTIFTYYEITNMSTLTYWESNIGVWTDFDIGDYNDDYVGCDVERGLYFGYNGTQFDSDYKEFPPAQGVMFLGGAFQDNDGQDNPVGINVGESLNGFGYGDGTIDNERMGMMGFQFYNNNFGATGNPQTPADYANYLTYRWLDGSYQYYGGNGHINGGGDTNFVSRYTFPHDTDPLGWGTFGNPQAAWSMKSAGFTPGDVRGVGESGSFTWAPGGIQYLDMAYIFAQDLQQPYDSLAAIAILQQYADDVKEMFLQDSTTCGTTFNPVYDNTGSGLDENDIHQAEMSIYPNPANNELFIRFNEQNLNINYGIYNMVGQQVQGGTINANLTKVKINDLPKGIYFIQIGNGNAALSEKFIKQ